jgi:hypothetical protein
MTPSIAGGTIRTLWSRENGQRTAILDRMRQCAALTDPTLIPFEGQTPDQVLPTSFQSLGSYGLSSLEGKSLAALWGGPWFRYLPAASIRHSSSVNPADLQELEQQLFMRELTMLATLESAPYRRDVGAFDAAPRRKSGFKSRKRVALSYVFACGDVLEQLTDDYRIKVFRPDQYTTLRDSCGDVLHHCVRERIDVASLPKEAIAKANLGDIANMGTPVAERMKDLYTLIEWSPFTKKWVITQEVNNVEIVTSEEPVSPYFATPYKLVSGENYGRGKVEELLADLQSFDNLRERLLDYAHACSHFTVVKNYGSQVRDQDLAGPSGKIMFGSVQGGQVQDIAYLNTNKLNDFNVCFQTMETIRRDLGRAFLIEGETTPRGERVTAYQVSRVALELEQGLGGAYSSISDYQQVPLIERLEYQMVRDGVLTKLPKGSTEVSVLTGLAAIEASNRAGAILEYAQVVASLGPEAIRRIDMGVLADVLARFSRIQEPGLIKTREQLEDEQRQAMSMQQAMLANEKATEVIGNVAQAALSPTG